MHSRARSLAGRIATGRRGAQKKKEEEEEKRRGKGEGKRGFEEDG